MKEYTKTEINNFKKSYLKKILKTQNQKLNEIWGYLQRGVATDKDDKTRDTILYNIDLIENALTLL